MVGTFQNHHIGREVVNSAAEPTDVGKFAVFKDEEIVFLAQSRQPVCQISIEVLDDVDMCLLVRPGDLRGFA